MDSCNANLIRIRMNSHSTCSVDRAKVSSKFTNHTITLKFDFCSLFLLSLLDLLSYSYTFTQEIIGHAYTNTQLKNKGKNSIH